MAIAAALSVLLTVIVLRLVYYFQLSMGEAAGFESPELTRTCVLLALTLPLSILIHEAGHWILGVALGQTCSRFAIGPVELAREAGGWKLRLVRIRLAGVVALVPSTFVRFRWQRALVAAGGPFASLVSGVVFTALAMRSRTSSRFWFWCCCTQWSILFLASLLPARSGASLSDGCLIWEAIRGGAAFDCTQRDLLTPSSHATTLRPRDFPQDLILRLTSVTPASELTRYNFYVAHIHAMDRGDTVAARRYLTELLTVRYRNDPPEYALEAAYFAAFPRSGSAIGRGMAQWNLRR